MIFWGKKWCALNLTNYRKTSNHRDKLSPPDKVPNIWVYFSSAAFFCASDARPTGDSRPPRHKDTSTFIRVMISAPRRTQTICEYINNTASAQSYPRHAYPLYGSVLMQVYDRKKLRLALVI